MKMPIRINSGTIAYLAVLAAFAINAHANNDGAEQLMKAAKGGDADAQLHLAWAYNANPDNPSEGKIAVPGISRDPQKATYWLRQAAAQGNGTAQICLGDAYSFGQGVVVDFKQSLYWYGEAARQKNPSSTDRIEGLKSILSSPVRTQTDKQAVQAAFHEDGKEAAVSAALIQLAETGDVVASRRLGGRYWSGLGVSENRELGLKLTRFAAEKGDSAAQSFLGAIYSIGVGVPQNFTEAATWLRKAADQSDAVAQYNLALAYFRGDGIPKDQSQAIKLLKMSAAQGNAGAQDILAKIQKENQGPPVAAPMPSLKETLRANCISDLDHILGKGAYEVLDFALVPIDPEVSQEAYQFTALITVRFKDPYGSLKRIVMYAACSNGAVFILSDASIFYRSNS